MIARGIVRKFGRLIAQAERHAIEGIEAGKLDVETFITDRFFYEIELIFEQHGKIDSIRFDAKPIRGIGRNAPEHQFGADILGVLNVELKNFKQSKGFLLQAKMEGDSIRVRRGSRGSILASFPGIDHAGLLGKQVNDMLSVTADSFVIVYAMGGFVVVPASAVKSLEIASEVYAKRIDAFFKEFLMCFVGDHRLNAADYKTLESRREEVNARAAILLEVREQLKGQG